uniref:Uncharacterized protein n=1 Tax=Candidatus Kentrum sp. LPFa TaxID=2126335 RepID=A0A450Y2M0_9GAMM|nr:MAG: hypothetical protein BECKLPF1236A_GA0070988_101583 [Candidatus Kentron sp. LPFa]VFK35774.1 MAG: hypothetical protein BECKLPF1236C_GA0070990_104201 [Candidatus Kentron sp. LPFa]
MGTADSRPSVNISSLFQTRATTKDALIHSNEITEQEALTERIESAITDYQATLSMPDTIGRYRIRGPQRIEVLRFYARNQ